MEPNEYYYKKVIGAIGGAMLIFWGLINVFGIAITLVVYVPALLGVGDVASNVIYQLVYAAGYLTCFMLPVAFLRLFLRRAHCPIQPMAVAPRVSPWLPFMIFAGLAICFSAAQINAAMVSIFDYSEFSSEYLWGESATMAPYELVLSFIVMCVVPGFCEEFLFRGAIMSTCMPFGKSNAILISAFLFAMMHQNAEQVLYTFVAGIVLGLVYERTGSIWNCTVLHLLNNFVSVAESAVFYKLGDSFEGNLIILLIEGSIYLLGAISIGILVMRFGREKKPLSSGFFGKEVAASDFYATSPIAGKRASRLFLQPTMVIFLALCLLQIVMLIGLALMLS
ncbi:MAG: CPBP family intramembrane metalloprotease [Clostridia bacterium]|nr:CPBP family intramembrane metalloprotease [Clostridia bacterium]